MFTSLEAVNKHQNTSRRFCGARLAPTFRSVRAFPGKSAQLIVKYETFRSFCARQALTFVLLMQP
jgi:hypothetical protein